jgi:hypothetical protein
MSFQILDIVLYGDGDRRRVLSLRPGEVNVIVGDSKTGKSALIDIVDYCLGRESYNVPQGIIRQTVRWYGLRLQLADGEAFIARRAPSARQSYTQDIYYEIGSQVSIPDAASFHSMTNIEGLEWMLSKAAGIRDNLHEPPPGQTRQPLEATIRHALFFVFQQQDELLSRKHLFHRQSEQFIPQAIKDVLPYFLGAVEDDFVSKKEQLRRLRNQLKERERKLAEMNAIRGDGVSKASSLLAEARDLGLVEETQGTLIWEEIVNKLRTVAQRPIQDVPEAEIGGEAIEQLSATRERLLAALQEAKSEIEAVRSLIADERGFAREASEQAARLTSIGLFSGAQDNPLCPLCQHPVQDQVPTIAEMQSSLSRVTTQLDRVTKSSPKLERVASDIEARIADIKLQLAKNKEESDAIRRSSERLMSLRDQNTRTALVIGRISLYLESLPELEDTSALQTEIRRLREQVDALEVELSNERTQERIDSMLSNIGRQMSEWAQRLQLEHAEYPLRIDLRRLNIVADTDNGPLPMDTMGSGENWVGYHLVAHLALHQWFTRKQRPVPRFLFLDQPSEAYFPSDDYGENLIELPPSKDRDSVTAMFRLIFDVVEALSPHFQIVLTEHANLREAWFRNAVRETWRGGNALIPIEWKIG